MNCKAMFLLAIVRIFCEPFCCEASAQDQSCSAIHAMAQMVKSNTVEKLNSWKSVAGDSHLANGVYAFRFFELKPQDHAAANSVLSFIPRTQEEDLEWIYLATPLCKNEELTDKQTLALLNARRSRDLARAIVIVPDMLFNYISYAEIAAQNPDSDYAEQMETVCHTKKSEFIDAFNKLPVARKNWYIKKIFNPVGCHALTHPEAESLMVSPRVFSLFGAALLSTGQGEDVMNRRKSCERV